MRGQRWPWSLRSGLGRHAVQVLFAGDRRVWKAAALAAVPAVALLAFYCLRPNFYYTGTNSVAEGTHLEHVPARTPVCTPAVLELPAGTAFVRLRLRSPTRERPALHLTLRVGSSNLTSSLPPLRVASNRLSNADFPVPKTPGRPAARYASLCAQADEGEVEWAATAVPSIVAQSVKVGGAPLPAQLAVWFLPPAGSQRSYVQEAGAIFRRAAMFRASFVGAWTYGLLILLVLPGIGLLGIRCLAVALGSPSGTTAPSTTPDAATVRGSPASAGSVAVGWSARRAAGWVFAIAAVNFACWALITPAFQAPDEVDHFAYVQSVIERGEGPSTNPAAPLDRWSSAESLALEASAFPTDHERPDTRMPGTALAADRYRRLHALEHPPADNAGGYSTTAVHGPLYYLALAPGYLAAGPGATFSQLTLMRLMSALLGALAALFAFLIARELAPSRPWLAVLAGLLVAYQPMYGFISGTLNNDVGVNAAAAAAAFLLIRALRRGMNIRWGLLTGVTLVAMPLAKQTGLSLYPVAVLALVAALALHHRRRDLSGWVSLAAGAISMDVVSARVLSMLQPSAAANGFSAIGSNTSAAHEAVTHIPEFLSYLWQIFLPRLPGMAQHFDVGGIPGFTIFVRRGWGAFGWYDIFFPHWVYLAILAVMLAAVPVGVLAVRREWRWIRHNWLETMTVVLVPVAVIAGFEAAYFSPGVQTIVPTFGRYVFPAIAPLAVLVVGVLHGFGRRNMFYCGVALLVAMIALSYGSQLLTLTSFYA
jgi:hypothetical protein